MGGVIDWLVKMWEAVRMLANEVGVASANPTNLLYVSERDGAVVKLTDSYPCGWGSIPAKAAVFSVTLGKNCTACVLISI